MSAESIGGDRHDGPPNKLTCPPNWITFRYAGFLVPAEAAVAGVAMVGMANQLKETGWWPWSMMLAQLPRRHHNPASLWSVPLMALAIAIAGAWHLSRREVI